MTQPFPPVVTKQYLIEREKWLNEIKRGENTAILFFPKTDRYRRIHQTLEDKVFLKKFLGSKSRYLFQTFDFNISLVEDKFDLEETIAKELNLSHISGTRNSFDEWVNYFQRNNFRLVLILPDAEKYLTPENKHILTILFAMSLDYGPTISVLSFYEVDIMHSTYASMVYTLKDLHESIFYYPLYSETDTLDFLSYLEQKWDMHLTPKQKQEIRAACGGHFWLVKEAVREQLNTGKWNINNEGMTFRINWIFSSLLSSEQTVLQSLLRKKKPTASDEQHSLNYLKQMNCIGSDETFTIGLMESFLRKRTWTETNLILKNNHVLLNQVPIEAMFSRKEHRIVKVLLSRKGEIVSRDEIAKSIWPINTEIYYSDWAIDQLIARIRKRFMDLSLPTSLIQVVRGRGYKISAA